MVKGNTGPGIYSATYSGVSIRFFPLCFSLLEAAYPRLQYSVYYVQPHCSIGWANDAVNGGLPCPLAMIS
jgi:hypothetical protein